MIGVVFEHADFKTVLAFSCYRNKIKEGSMLTRRNVKISSTRTQYLHYIFCFFVKIARINQENNIKENELHQTILQSVQQEVFMNSILLFQGDKKTRHAACPVLLGHKWVSNLWIHEHGQEFFALMYLIC